MHTDALGRGKGERATGDRPHGGAILSRRAAARARRPLALSLRCAFLPLSAVVEGGMIGYLRARPPPDRQIVRTD